MVITLLLVISIVCVSYNTVIEAKPLDNDMASTLLQFLVANREKLTEVESDKPTPDTCHFYQAIVDLLTNLIKNVKKQGSKKNFGLNSDAEKFSLKMQDLSNHFGKSLKNCHFEHPLRKQAEEMKNKERSKQSSYMVYKHLLGF